MADWEHPRDTAATLDIPYWVVRNSWSTEWNPECVVNGIAMPGYCKIAFTDPSRNINTKVYLDNAEDGMVGAAVAFMPKVTRTEPKRRGESQVDEEPDMYEERIVSAEETTGVKLAAASASATARASEGESEEERRDHVNHPIHCDVNTPTSSTKVNCARERTRAQQRRRRLNPEMETETKTKQGGGILFILLLLLPVLIGVVVAAIIMRRVTHTGGRR